MYSLSRRRFAALAAGALVVALTGCDSDSTDAADLGENRAGAMAELGVDQQFTATEALTFPILYLNHPNYPIKKDWLFWSELTKRTGVTLQPTEVPLSDYEQKRGLLLGAGDAPFIIPKTYPHQEDAYVGSGTILPVSDYLDLMPNFKDKVAKWNLGPEIDTLRQEDGKFYLLPGLHEEVWPDYSIAIRTDILAELNLAVPKTWDELHTVLKAMKAKYPNQYPFSDRWGVPTPGGSLLNQLAGTYGTHGGWGYLNANWDAAAGKFAFTGAQEGYKQMLQFLNTLVKEKLLDPESFTQSDDQAIQKLVTGKSFVISANAQSIVNEYRPALTKANPKATIVKIPVPDGPAGHVLDTTRLENGLMVTKKARESKNFVAMMQFIDWLWYSDQGQEFAKWGVPGTTYNKDASGKRTLAADVDMVGLNPKGTKHLQKDFGFGNGVFAYGGTTELLQSTFSAEEIEFQKAMATKTVVPPAPPHPFTDEEREQATLWESPLKDHVTASSLQFILGQRDFSQWDAYLGELRTKNMDQYLDLVVKARDRYAKDHGGK